MQIQKDEVKNKIIEAALEEFLIYGYSQSSMRNIAAAAGITVGNIYSYFSGKEDLFENVVGDTALQLKNLVFIEVPSVNPSSSTSIIEMTHIVTDVFLNNRAKFLILMDGSEGSKYEDIKVRLTELAGERLKKELSINLKLKKFDELLINSLAVAIIEGIINIFKKYGGDVDRLELLVSEFLIAVLGDIYNRL